MPEVYSGSEPYIFVSYAHKDSDAVLPLIHSLMHAGFRVWYDDGIEIGTEWPEFIATKLFQSRCVLAFISPNAVNSKNCRREINFAIDKDKELLAVYLEMFDLPLGMQMQLNTLQAFNYTDHSQESAFLDKLCHTPLLRECLQVPEEPEAPAVQPEPVAEEPEAPAMQPEPVAEEPEAPEPIPETIPEQPVVAQPAPVEPAPPKKIAYKDWICSCGQKNAGDARRCACGKWCCSCGSLNASYVSSCVCGLSKMDVLINTPQAPVKPAAKWYLTPSMRKAAVPSRDWLCTCGANHPISEKRCSCGIWHCSCGRLNAAYVSSCVCGISKWSIF